MSVLDEIAGEREFLAMIHPAAYQRPDGINERHDAAMAATALRAAGHTWSWRSALMAEIMCAFAAPDRAALRKRLVRAAATIVRWIESIDGTSG